MRFYPTRFLLALFLLLGLSGLSLNGQAETAKKLKEVGLIVSDQDGNLVKNLKKDELAVSLNGTPFTNFELLQNSLPSAVVLALDNSGSLRQVLKETFDGALEVAAQNDRKNIFLLMRFVSRDKIQIADRFSSDIVFLESKRNMFFIEGGQTAVIDAVHKAVQIVSGQKNLSGEYRRAVVVISDGEDRDSQTSVKELQDLIAKENVQVYFIGLTELLPKDAGFIGKSPANKSKQFIDLITSESGGTAVFPDLKEINNAARSIREILNDHYILALELPETIPAGSRIQIDFAAGIKRKKAVLRYRPLVN